MASVLSMETTADPGTGFSQQCSSCDDPSARCWCLDCNEALCDVCVSAHRRVTVTRSHRILNQLLPAGASTPPTKFCRLHPSEPLKLFCFTCNQLTCRDCQLMAHMNHRYQFVGEAMESLKKQLEISVQSVRPHCDTVTQSLLDMKTRLQDIAKLKSHLNTKLQQSFNVLVQCQKKKMEEILNEIETLTGSECDRIHRRMMELKQLQQNQQSVTEAAEKAKDSSDLSTLLTCKAQIEAQLKDLLNQDSSPLQMMCHLNVLIHKMSLEAILKFCELEVSWIPFSVSQTSNQNRDTPAACSSSSPLTPTCPAPSWTPVPQTSTTIKTDSLPPVPVDCSSTSKSLSTHLCPTSSSLSSPPSSSSSSTVNPPTTTFVSPSGGALAQATNSCHNQLLPPVTINCPSASWKSSSSHSSINQSSAPVITTAGVPFIQPVRRPASSTVNVLSQQTSNPRQVLLLKNQVQPVSVLVNLQPVSFTLSTSAGPSPSCTPLNLIQPSLVLTQPKAPRQNQPATILLANSQPVYQVSSVPRSLTLLSPMAPHTLPTKTRPEQQRNFGRCHILPAVARGTQISIRPSDTARPSHQQTSDHQPQTDESCTTLPGVPTIPSVPLSSHERLISDISPWSSSPKQQQQSPVVMAVADSACDRSEPSVTAKQQEPTENEPTSTVSEGTEPAGKLSAPEVPDRKAEELSSVIGHPDCPLSQWQPRVSLFRLPVSPSRPRRPLPGFRLVCGDNEDEIYLEEMSHTESHVDDVTDDVKEPPSSPESPVTLQILSCSACGSANGSIVCSACGRGYHRDCHVPPVGPDLWSDWICSLCQDPSEPPEPSKAYSSDTAQRPQSPCLSLQDQKRCESLLLFLKVEGCRQLPELVGSRLEWISARLTLRRPPSYQTAADFLSDIWSLFRDASQDDEVLNELRERFQRRLTETFGPELHPSVLMPVSCSRDAEGGKAAEEGSKVTSEEQEVISCKKTRKRLRVFLGLVRSGSKRTKTDKMEE